MGVLSLFAIAGYGAALSFLVFRAHNATQTITVGNSPTPSVLGVARSLITPSTEVNLQGKEDGRINILLLGKAGKNYPGQNLTDTIMIASFDTHSGRASLLSLPRDLYVPIENSSSYTKINALYALGSDKNPFDVVRPGIENITDLTLHYAVMVDYKAFISVINAIGGIHVMVERDIYDTRFPGPNYSYTTFELKKGFHKLDGETALKYVRERHSDPRGDFGRVERQQQTLKAVKNKIFSTGTYLNPIIISKLLSSLEDNVRTDITLQEIESFIELAKQTDLENMEMVVVDAWRAESLLRVLHVYLDNGQRMSALTPRTGNFEELRDTAENIFDKNLLEKRYEKIKNESASIVLVSYGNARVAERVQQLLGDLGFSRPVIYYEDAFQGAPEHSLVIDQTKLSTPFSLDELLRVLPATKSDAQQLLPSRLDTEQYDLIVIIGEDATERHDWKEVDINEWTNSNNVIEKETTRPK